MNFSKSMAFLLFKAPGLAAARLRQHGPVGPRYSYGQSGVRIFQAMPRGAERGNLFVIPLPLTVRRGRSRPRQAEVSHAHPVRPYRPRPATCVMPAEVEAIVTLVVKHDDTLLPVRGCRSRASSPARAAGAAPLRERLLAQAKLAVCDGPHPPESAPACAA